MKNLVKLVTPEEIHAYVMGLWSDGLIKKSHQDGGIVFDLIEKFAEMPRVFFDASNMEIEWTHFSAWWGAIVHAEYDNPIIRDLRYLHEIYHAATFPHQVGLSVEEMRARNFQNEREASVFTEIAIYLEIPELRAQSFDHPIFADTIINDPDWQQRWSKDRDAAMVDLIAHRAAVVSASGDSDDPQLIWLQRYREQEKRWVAIWKDDYDVVDAAMLRLRANPNRQAGLDDHLVWLKKISVDDVPFYENAVRFRQAYDELLNAYNEAMEVAGKNPVAYRHK